MISSDEMRAELRARVVPDLRKAGFKGSFPHFHRITANGVDILGFQFSQWGGAFVVNLGWCPPSGMLFGDGTAVPAKETRYYHVRHRKRIVTSKPGESERWFRFDQDPPDGIVADLLAKLAAPDLWQGLESM